MNIRRLPGDLHESARFSWSAKLGRREPPSWREWAAIAVACLLVPPLLWLSQRDATSTATESGNSRTWAQRDALVPRALAGYSAETERALLDLAAECRTRYTEERDAFLFFCVSVVVKRWRLPVDTLGASVTDFDADEFPATRILLADL